MFKYFNILLFLYWTILSCTIFTVLSGTVLYCNVIYCSVMYLRNCTGLFCTIPGLIVWPAAWRTGISGRCPWWPPSPPGCLGDRTRARSLITRQLSLIICHHFILLVNGLVINNQLLNWILINVNCNSAMAMLFDKQKTCRFRTIHQTRVLTGWQEKENYH